MAKVPKEIREVTKRLDRTRFQIARRAKHWAITDLNGSLVVTIHCNHGDRGLRNQLAELKRQGVLKEGR